jgi:hypothetical protein
MAYTTEMKEEEVNRCQIHEWFPKFKPVSIRTIILELRESLFEYLLDDPIPSTFLFLSQMKMPCRTESTIP